MTSHTDPVLLALLAALEARGKAKGEKSIVKGVVARLADAGADPALIAEIAALRKKGVDAKATIQAAPTSRAAAPAKAKASAKPKARVTEPKAVVPEEPTAQA